MAHLLANPFDGIYTPLLTGNYGQNILYIIGYIFCHQFIQSDDLENPLLCICDDVQLNVYLSRPLWINIHTTMSRRPFSHCLQVNMFRRRIWKSSSLSAHVLQVYELHWVFSDCKCNLDIHKTWTLFPRKGFLSRLARYFVTVKQSCTCFVS